MKRIYTEQPVIDYVNDTDWYRFDPETLCRKLGTDMQTGLSRDVLKLKREVHEKNDIFPDDGNSGSNAPKTAFSVLSALLIIMLALSWILMKDKTAAAGILMTALGHIAVLILFRIARKAVSGLAGYSVPEVRVIRDGKKYRISQRSIVQGDLIYLSEGDLVPCDGRLISSNSLRVLEKNISGGDGVKDASFVERMNGLEPAMQKSMVFARSAVSSGSCYMIACDTGSHTLPVRRGIKAKSAGSDALDVFTKVTAVSRIYAVLCSIILFAVTVFAFVTRGETEIFGTFLLLLSVAASSYCELLCAFSYLAIGYGIYPSENKNSEYNNGVIIKNLSAVKRLRELTCLLVPKSSGICEKRIVAEKIYTNDRELDVSEENTDRLRRTVYTALSTFGGRERHAKSQTALTQEQDAIMELAARLGIGIDETERAMLPLDSAASDGERLFDTALVIYKEQYMICVRGSATQVVNRCTSRISNGSPVPLSADGRTDLLKRASAYEGEAYRVTAIATKPSRYNNLDRIGYTEDDLCFEGFIVMREPFSETCSDTVAALDDLGVKTVMFCDDMTAQSVNLAKHIGICRDESQMLSAPEFVSSNIHIIDLKMSSYRLFRGLSNRQKRYVCDSYLAANEHIGVIGQHLYDISLMNGTDTVGFAANLTLTEKKRKNGAEITSSFSSDGSEALKRAADVVILPADENGAGGINAAYDAILTARRVCNNIRNILFYIIASNAARLMSALLAIFTRIPGMDPVQMIFSGIVVDLLAVMSICASNNRKMSEERDLYAEYSQNGFGTTLKALASGLFCGLLSIGASFMTAALFNNGTSASAVCFTSLVILQLCLCAQIMRGRYGFFDGMNNMFVISAMLVLEYLIASALFPVFFAERLTGTVYTSGIFICLLPALVFSAVCFVIRLLKKRKIQKK